MIKQKAFTLLETLLALAVGAVLIIVVIKKYQQYQHQIAYEQTKNYLQDIFDYLRATYKMQHCEKQSNSSSVIAIKNFGICFDGRNIISHPHPSNCTFPTTGSEPNEPNIAPKYQLLKKGSYQAKIAQNNNPIASPYKTLKDYTFKTYHFEVTAKVVDPNKGHSLINSLQAQEYDSASHTLTFIQPVNLPAQIASSSINISEKANQRRFKNLITQAPAPTDNIYPCINQ